MVEKTNHFLSLKQVTIRDPFFSPVQNTVIHTMIPYQEKVLHDEIPDIRPSHVIRNYRIAAGEIEGTYYGRVFQDSDLAKWLEAVAYSLTVQPERSWKQERIEIIDLIGRVKSRTATWIHTLSWQNRRCAGRISATAMRCTAPDT